MTNTSPPFLAILPQDIKLSSWPPLGPPTRKGRTSFFIFSAFLAHPCMLAFKHPRTLAHSRTSQTFRLSPIFHCVSAEAIFLKLHFKSFFVRILLLSTMDEKKNHLSTKEKLSWLNFLFFCLQIGRTRMLAFSSRMDIHFIEYSPRDYVIRIGAPLLPKSF